MVKRKPVPSQMGTSPSPVAAPPYPVTPVDQTSSSSSSALPRDSTQVHVSEALSSDDDSSENEWDSNGGEEDEDDGHPAPTQEQQTNRLPQLNPPIIALNDIPQSLVPGPSGLTPKTSNEMEWPADSKNPYAQRQKGGEREESSAAAWGDDSNISDTKPDNSQNEPVQKDNVPVNEFANLSMSDQNTNPWQPALDEKAHTQQSSIQQPSIPPLERQDSGNDAWYSNTAPARPPPAVPTQTENTSRSDSPAWDEEAPEPAVELSTSPPQHAPPIAEEENAWQETEQQRNQEERDHNLAVAAERAAQQEYLNREGGDWAAVQTGPQESGTVESSRGSDLIPVQSEEPAPALPPRRSPENPPPQPPRPQTNTSSSRSGPELSEATIEKQKKETYEIKKISWYDAIARSNPRVSPILIQNANGPCPLLALVNALTLSTPADANTALVETLRSREQVSLGLLLDAVFDELMSGRRGDGVQELPDIGDLYSFLITLHTGMNVNPRFFPPPELSLPNNPRSSMSHIHPAERDDSVPGTFELTRELKLYSTFSIPLIHGWLPAANSPAYTALKRSAKSYEEAQNLMFREDELEHKLQTEGLGFEEQATLEDIATIRAFLNSSATQLTPHGLDTVKSSMSPGSVAILFRNDHFSTLYRHPDNGQLVHLVTDMGYAGHEEVVWESLGNVNGDNCDFFSGDFKLVGGASTSAPTAEQSNNNAEWTTAPSRGSRRSPSSRQSGTTAPGSIDATVANNTEASQYSPSGPAPGSPTTEQEDHDLALAIQLQEEEDERHRAETARRRREAELSQQYIEQQGRESTTTTSASAASRNSGGAANVPVTQRTSSTQQTQTRRPPPRNANTSATGPAAAAAAVEARPLVPPRGAAGGGGRPPADDADAPPPTYEQAATDVAYNPPPNHPAHPSASSAALAGGSGRRLSAFSTTAAASGNAATASSAGPGRTAPGRTGSIVSEVQGQGRRSQAGSGASQGQPPVDRDRDCAVM